MARDRALQAVDLRKQGLAFESIARKLGYNSRQAAHKAVTELLQETAAEGCEDLRQLELMRLDGLWETFYKQAVRGSPRAAYVCARLSERRSRLLGLDAPTKVDAQVAGSLSGGVLVTPGLMDPAAWTRAAEQQQQDLSAAEKQFVKTA